MKLPEKFRLSSRGTRLSLVLLLSAILGFCAVVIPGLLNCDSIAPTPLFPQVRAGVKNMPSLSYFLLFLVGAVFGTIEPKRPKLIGMSSIILFPLVTVAEKSIDISSHPYMAWEITYYLLLGLASTFGAFLGKELRT